MIALDRVFETLQPGWPQFGEERVERFETFGVDHVEATLPVSMYRHQPSLSQHLQVEGHRLLGYIEPISDLVHSLRLIPHEAKDLAPVRLGERLQNCVRGHPRILTQLDRLHKS